jgi:PIN domain nuclease of toxin-antitoxin system
MGLLLDTHVLIWWFADDPKFPLRVRNRLETSADEIFVSSVSAFEIATKHRIGKLPHVEALLDGYAGHLAGQGFVELPVSSGHALKAGALPFDHRDPFDRLLIAQALTERLSLVSNEAIFDQTGVSRVW